MVLTGHSRVVAMLNFDRFRPKPVRRGGGVALPPVMRHPIATGSRSVLILHARPPMSCAGDRRVARSRPANGAEPAPILR